MGGKHLSAGEKVDSASTALASAGEMGFPLVLKIVSPDIAHEPEVGGVFVAVRSEAQLLEEYVNPLARLEQKGPETRIAGVLVAQLVQGGIFAEIFKDVALQPAPVGEAHATAMRTQSLKAAMPRRWSAASSRCRPRPRSPIARPSRAAAMRTASSAARRWRIAARTVIYDWIEERTRPELKQDAAALFDARRPVGTAAPHDAVYALLSQSRGA